VRRLGGLAGLIVAAALAGCARDAPSPPPKAPVPYGPGIAVVTTPVRLNPTNPRQVRIGRFVYVGGLVLTSYETSRLHGLSDLKVWPDGRLLAVGDEGDVLEGRIVLSPGGKLIGFHQARLSDLMGEDGKPVATRGKRESDSEGIAELANGDRLASFEEDDRILLYPHDGVPPRRAPMPAESFPFNSGMEAIAQDPAAGPDAYLVGGEASGQTWVCRLSGACTPEHKVAKDKEFGLTAVAPLPQGRTAYLLRAFDPLRGARIRLSICCDARGRTLDELDLARPLTVDNFEGLAAVPGVGGQVRFYIVSDDNFSRLQRTLLLAFDWRPPKRR
jgi:hypothetical protein